jgi:hypothetical protein
LWAVTLTIRPYEVLKGIPIFEYDLLDAVESRLLYGRMLPKQSEQHLGIEKRNTVSGRLHIHMQKTVAAANCEYIRSIYMSYTLTSGGYRHERTRDECLQFDKVYPLTKNSKAACYISIATFSLDMAYTTKPASTSPLLA